MLGHVTRDARRTERYLNGLMTADERRAHEVPADTELDPAIPLSARELRAGLIRVHPSFRFEESLATRLGEGAARLKAGMPVEEATADVERGSVAQFRSHPSPAAGAATAAQSTAVPDTHGRAIWPAAAFLHFPEMATRPSRPLIVGGVGVGVASAAISIGAAYVVWRHSHPASGRMGRAVREAHGRASQPSHSRRSGVIHGILGVVS
jgi:hypothetical protein